MKRIIVLILIVAPGIAVIHGQAGDYTFTSIDIPGAASTEVLGINNGGVMVGAYNDGTEDRGFIFEGTNVTTLDLGSKTRIYDINNSGNMV